MKKRVMGFFIGLMTLVCSTQFVSAGQPYFNSSLSRASLDDSNITARRYDLGTRFTAAVGLSEEMYRIETEFGTQSNGIKNSNKKLATTSWMVNAYYDINPPLTPARPFVVAGMGFANVDEDDGFGMIFIDRVFAWQVGAGVGFTVAPTVTADLQYRYCATTDPVLISALKYSNTSNNVSLGVRVGF